MKKENKKWLIIVLTIIFIVAISYACYKLIPLLDALKDKENQEKFNEYIDNLGFKGIFIIIIIQTLQVFIAFIPGEIVEILSGILYGALGGLIVCLIGSAIGAILIYYTIKLFANKHLIKYKEKLKTYNFLKNPKKVHIYLFIIFFIPGIPKDIFLYLVPFLPIKFSSFLVLSSIARIPSILSSTIVGGSLIEGNYLLSVIVFSSFLIIGILGILFKDKLMNLFRKNNKEEINNTQDNMEN